jgi:ABC-type dipeptide/oligopeptide/nickel transport system ATPase component
MADGRIVEEGPSADVVTNPTHPATAALVTAASKSALALARR